MNSPELQKQFHEQADLRRFWNRRKNPYLRRKEEELSRRILGNCDNPQPRLLEVGCGEGNNLLSLQELNPAAACFGLDFSPAKLRFLREHSPQCLPVCGDAAALPFKDNRFDLVLLRDLLHHLPWAKETVLRESWRVARPGGRIIVLEGRGDALLNRIFQRLHPVERGMAESTPANLLSLGERFTPGASLEFVEASYLLRAVGFVMGWPEGRMGRIVRPLYRLASWWDLMCAAWLPRRRWTLMMLTLVKD
ncbi:MAG: class I SAM-dependent methyltransferase [Deltaproteobacteria bacterium]|nr:MAG: class I SAM-dependent methyltransferase [Deltaproteobacteria bacterium]